MTLNTATHRAILINILKDIYTDATVGPHLGFKGGTAAYLFYQLNRFSVDLDFDLLDTASEEQIFIRIQKILEKYGTLKEARKKRFCLFYLLSYHNKLQNAFNIKVEINTRKFGSSYEIKPYLGIQMNVMVPADMAAHKLVAMYERKCKTHRDIFDAYFFLKNNWPINEKIIEKRTSMSMNMFLQTCIDMLSAMSDKGILSGMGELLDDKQKAWVKTHLRTETIFLLNVKLTQ